MGIFANFLNNSLDPNTGQQVRDFYQIQTGPDGQLTYTGNESPYNQINPYAYMGDEKEGGSRLFADIIRAQTDDYLTRFAPIEDYLAGSITPTGTTFLEGDMARTRQAVTDSAANVGGQYSRNMQRYGLSGGVPDFSNQTVSAMVGGLNDTRDRDADRRLAILGGGLGTISQKSRAQQGG